MFEPLLSQGGPRRRLGAGTTVSLVMHIGVVMTAAWVTKHVTRGAETPVEVTLIRQPMAPPPPPPPPPPAARRPKQTKVKPKPHPVVPQAIVAPKVVPDTPPPEEPKEEPPEEEGEAGGVEVGVGGGVVGGAVGGIVGSPLPSTPVRMGFNETLAPP